METDETAGQGLEEQTVEETPVAQETGGSGGINPAWNPLLEVLPSSLHSLVTPHLSEWDKNFQTKLNEVHSTYANYKPFLEQQIDPELINQALGIRNAIETRPLEVINALKEYAKSQGMTLEEAVEEQGQIDETEISADILNHPEYKKLQAQVETITQVLLQQRQMEEQSAEDKRLADELESLRQTKGDFDVDWVVTKAYQAAQMGQAVNSLEPFVDAYKAHEAEIIAKTRKPAPKVLGGGGIAPDTQADVTQLDSKGRRNLITSMLQAAAQNSQ